MRVPFFKTGKIRVYIQIENDTTNIDYACQYKDLLKHVIATHPDNDDIGCRYNSFK